MTALTAEQIKQFFPNATRSVIAANELPPSSTGIRAESARADAVPECAPVHDSLEAAQAKSGDRCRFIVRLTSVRKRLLDEDNLVGKYHTDLCRYAGIIPADSPETTSIQTHQRKAEKGEEEYTLIEIYRLPPGHGQSDATPEQP